jgi:hypothetical protein
VIAFITFIFVNWHLFLKTPKISIYDNSVRKYGDTLIKSRENSKLLVYIYPRAILGYYRRRYSTAIDFLNQHIILVNQE